MPWKLSYAGVDLPPPDANGFAPTLQPVDIAERNANGDMLIQEVAMKRTISVTWSALRGDQANLIYVTLEQNRTGTLVFYNIAKNAMDEMEAYHGAGVKISLQHYDENLEKQLWKALSINFIEM